MDSAAIAAMKIDSYRDILRQRRKQFEILIHRGDYEPFLLHHFLLLLILLVVPLLIPHNGHGISRYLRYIFFSLILSLGIYIIRCTRGLIVANGYCIGLVTAWWMAWSAVMLIFNDAQKDFKKIERDSNPISPQTEVDHSESTSPSSFEESKVTSNETTVRHRQTTVARGTTGRKATPLYRQRLKWQPFPDSFGKRLEWVLGLVFNFRGPEWNWRIPALPSLPKPVLNQLEGNTSASDEAQTLNLNESRECVKRALLTFLRSYITLDILKVIMMRDRYFWGFISDAAAPPFPFHILAASPPLVRTYRLLVSAIGIFTALNYVTLLNPVVFLGLSLAFPNASRALTGTPLEAAWLYPDEFGPFLTPVLDHSIAGCWGQWWHQLFRFCFTEPTRWLTSFLPENSQRHPGVQRIIQVLVSFAISGLLHASGSYCQFAPTTPWSGPFLFFFLQGPGILAQRFLAKTILPKILPFQPPRWLRRTTNFAVVIAWFIVTGPLIADDFALGGLWLIEPIPVSLLRGLGFGAEGEGWWSLHGQWFEWWSGKTWWQSGIRVL